MPVILRDCDRCDNKLPPGQRCPCGGWAPVKRLTVQKLPFRVSSDLRVAHHRALNKSKRSEFWKGRARARYRKAKRDEFTVTPHEIRARGGQNNKAVAWFMYRCELSDKSLRNGDEIASLMHLRLVLCIDRKTNAQVREWLDLSRKELEELDAIITDDYGIKIPRRYFDAPIPAVHRAMKKGVAKDRLRRYRMGLYKAGQILSRQQDSPLKS